MGAAVAAGEGVERADVRERLGDGFRDLGSPDEVPDIGERPLRTREHFRNVVGRRVVLRADGRSRLRGEVVAAGERAVTIKTDAETKDIPYDWSRKDG